MRDCSVSVRQCKLRPSPFALPLILIGGGRLLISLPLSPHHSRTMAESSRNAVLDNARRRIHIFRCTSRQRDEKRAREDVDRRGKRKERERWTDKETGARTEIKAKSGEGGKKEGRKRKVRKKKKKAEAVLKSLRLAKLRNMETPEPISRNHAADIGGAGGGG